MELLRTMPRLSDGIIKLQNRAIVSHNLILEKCTTTVMVFRKTLSKLLTGIIKRLNKVMQMLNFLWE